MKKKPRENSPYFKIFVGELVAITMNFKITGQEMDEDGSGKMTEEPLTAIGYLLEEDDQYYYLGEDPRQVTVAVKIKDVMITSVIEPADMEDRVLEGIPNKPKGEWN